MPKILGHHHISIHTANAQVNNHFYQTILGMRRVKKTVNQEDPTMYHLFYGDNLGSPGTALTFLEMPMLGEKRRGTNSISAVGLLVKSRASLEYWQGRFEELSVKHGEIQQLAGREQLEFSDPDGLSLFLVNHQEQVLPDFWEAQLDSMIPMEYRILGMGPTILTVREPTLTGQVLTELLGFKLVDQSNKEAVYQAVHGEVFGEIIVKQASGQREHHGFGSVHHLALRVKDSAELQAWAQRIDQAGYRNSGIKDRYYFESLYFRDRNSILFELATDGPGFTIDSEIADLGVALDLPPFLEEQRKEIEGQLLPLL